MMNPQYQQMTLDFVGKDDETNETASQTRTVIADDSAGDLVHVLTELTHFLRAAGFTYIGQLAAYNVDSDDDEPDLFGQMVG
jgi:hypothetical protein